MIKTSKQKTLVLSTFALLATSIAPAMAESAGQYIDDATISTKARAALIGDSQLKGTSISVETNKASVQLTGLVDTKEQKAEAVRVVDQVNGVKDVQDKMTVRGSSTTESE